MSIVEQIIKGEQASRRRAGQKPLKRLPKPPQPKSTRRLEARLSVELNGALRRMWNLYKSTVLDKLARWQRMAEVRADGERVDESWQEELSRVTGDFLAQADEETGESVRQSLSNVAGEVDASVLSSFRRQMVAALGVDVFTQDPNAIDVLMDWQATNDRRWTNVVEEFARTSEDVVKRGFQAGRRTPEIAEEIQKRLAVSQDRARLIARDQTQKLVGELTRRRQVKAGVQKYIWRTVRDDRVRGNPGGKYPNAKPSHWAREGEIFAWDEPPEGGHPGEPVNCRCFAEPYLIDLL